MAETVLDQILDDLRSQAVTHYPQRGEFKNLRVVGHTPKNDYFIYDVCIDFAVGSERVAIKIYRPGKCTGNAKSVARQENANLQYVNQILLKKSNNYLVVCSDIANGSKHFKVNPDRHHSVSGTSIKGAFDSNAFDNKAFDVARLVIDLDGEAANQLGSSIDAIELAREVLEFWKSHIPDKASNNAFNADAG